MALSFRNIFVFKLFFASLFLLGYVEPNISKNHDYTRLKRSYESRRNKDQMGNHLKGHHSGAIFITENSTSVVAQIGGTAKLPCVIRKINNGVVSWIRKEDSPPTILTVGLATYIADERYLVEHARHLQNWGLIIKHVKPSDAGVYECQVSTHPTTSILIRLKVTEASAEIVGAPDLHIKAGSLLRLVCTLRQSTEIPEYVFWYHEQRMINHDPGVSVEADKSNSVLQLDEADTSHNGNYTCYPSNAIPAYINVHVLNATEEENPAAMLHANSSDVSHALFFGIMVAVIINLFAVLNR